LCSRHPEDGHMSGRNMSVTTAKLYHKSKCICWPFNFSHSFRSWEDCCISAAR